MKLVSPLILIFFCAQFLNAQPDESMINELSVLTWNTAFLPTLSVKKKYQERMEEVAQLLLKSDVDVVALQEVFPKRILKFLRKRLETEFPFSITTKKKQFLFWQSSGLVVFSKAPIQYKAEIKFHTKSGFDKFAKKGALLVEGEKNENSFQLILTHMQSFPGKSNHEIRMIQLDQIRRELIEPNIMEDKLLIMVGDFNVNRHRSADHGDMLYVIQLEDATQTLSNQNSFVGFNNSWDAGRTLFFDHILFNGSATLKSIEFLDMLSSSGSQNLSDHKPLMAKFEF